MAATTPFSEMAILSLAELLGRYQSPLRTGRLQRLEKIRSTSSAAELDQLDEGDLVVHADYGIGRYRGLTRGEEEDEEKGLLCCHTQLTTMGQV